MADALIVFLGLLLTVFLGANIYLLRLLRKPAAPPAEDPMARFSADFQREITQLRSTVNDQILDLSRRVSDQLVQNNQLLLQSHQGYQEAVGQVQHRLGELQQATRSMMDVGKDISSLHDILRAPKLRGGMGELFLAELLHQILPEDHFVLQYGFRDGSKVDAVILLGQGMIPVDAKFPLENFRRMIDSPGEDTAKVAKKEFVRDVKKHIDAIASKYILPEENTFDFALMYVPAENVYYEMIIKDDQAESLASYAQQKKVIPVSPNSFYAYLQAIVRGLKGLRIERSAQLILESLGQLDTDFRKCVEDFEKVGTHLNNAQSAYRNTEKRLGRLQDRLSTIEVTKPAKPLFPESISDSTV
jgi:DNA recombination protein RmuC